MLRDGKLLGEGDSCEVYRLNSDVDIFRFKVGEVFLRIDEMTRGGPVDESDDYFWWLFAPRIWVEMEVIEDAVREGAEEGGVVAGVDFPIALPEGVSASAEWDD